MLSVVIYGASGYTGAELLRILASHPGAEVKAATSRQYAGKQIARVFPSLAGFYDGLEFTTPEKASGVKSDVAFSALPHGASMDVVPGMMKDSEVVVDLSADYRLKSKDTYLKWYGEHTSFELAGEAVYGLPELYRKELRSARLIANPGCYPTGAVLAAAPALGTGLLDATEPVIVDAKSGVSGAGRGAAIATSFVEVNEGFKAYKVGAHRHTPEMDQELGALSEGAKVVFTPHLLPVSRGILSTVYGKLNKGVSAGQVKSAYEAAYRDEPFVRLLSEGKFPDVRQVRCSNFCDIGLSVDQEAGRLIVVSAIDNLVKGASGQAVHNMNIATGAEETAGLNSPPAGI